jgi:hypothetical protein
MMVLFALTLNLLRWTILRAPTNASKWRMGFNSAFKGLSSSFKLTDKHKNYSETATLPIT